MALWLWVGFTLLVIGLLALDLGVFHRKAHVVSVQEALWWTAFWVGLALAFNALVYVMYSHHWLGIGLHVGHDLSGGEAAIEYLTAYVVEKSLSLDNIFVIALIFAFFDVPRKSQHRVLFWGILGAIIMRGVMILAGIAIIERFSWIVYFFGALLIAAAVRMLTIRHDRMNPESSVLLRLLRRCYPVTDGYHGESFFVRRPDGVRAATPLLLALVFIENSDLMFAIDSIPAVFAVTLDPFIVYTSNIFAILGLRSLYFALAAMMEKVRYLKPSLFLILIFVGVKMILTHHVKIAPLLSLAIILGILGVGVALSFLTPHARGDDA